MSKKSEKNRKKHQMRRIQNDTHIKELAAIKLFKESTRRILDILEIPDLFKLLPKKYVLSYYEERFGSLRLVPEEGKKIPRRVYREMCFHISADMKSHNVPLGKSEITLEDFLTAGFSLHGLALQLIDGRPGISNQVKEMLKKILENIPLDDSDQLRKLAGIQHAIEAIFTRINGTIYYTTSKTFSDVTGKKIRRSFSFIVHPVKAVIKDVMLDGKPRPSYRIGRPASTFKGILWHTLTGRELSLSLPDPDKPMDVYIQSHALIRFRERIDTLEHSFLHATLAYSLEEDKEIVVHNGTRLLTYKYDEMKMGYFPLEVVDDVVVLKTFLFITHTGTPEGDRLDAELKVGKLEKQFVGIDKLSTFINSDIMKDERVKNIFVKVGLGHLDGFDLENFDYLLSEKKGVAADIVKYMGIEKEEY